VREVVEEVEGDPCLAGAAGGGVLQALGQAFGTLGGGVLEAGGDGAGDGQQLGFDPARQAGLFIFRRIDAADSRPEVELTNLPRRIADR